MREGRRVDEKGEVYSVMKAWGVDEVLRVVRHVVYISWRSFSNVGLLPGMYMSRVIPPLFGFRSCLFCKIRRFPVDSLRRALVVGLRTREVPKWSIVQLFFVVVWVWLWLWA